MDERRAERGRQGPPRWISSKNHKSPLSYGTNSEAGLWDRAGILRVSPRALRNPAEEGDELSGGGRSVKPNDGPCKSAGSGRFVNNGIANRSAFAGRRRGSEVYWYSKGGRQALEVLGLGCLFYRVRF